MDLGKLIKDPLNRSELKALLVALQEELRVRKESADSRPDFLNRLFGPQADAFVDDAKAKCLRVGRRGGKSVCACAWLIDGALKTPNSLSLYLTLTRRNAELIAWPTLKWLDREMGLGMRFDEQNLRARLPNGSMIMLGGVKDRSEIERYRGPHYFRVVIDECGSFPPYLESLYRDVIRPACVDLDGQVMFCGTPGIVCQGLWYNMTGPESPMNVPVYHWTMFENPHIPHARRAVEEILKENGWDETHPTYVREYLGLWVDDATDLLIPFSQDRNTSTELPETNSTGAKIDPDGWRYCLGVDVGVVDATAFSLIAAHKEVENEYVIRTEKHTNWLTGQVAGRIRDYLEDFPGCRVVMDTGGMGKVHAEECRRRFAVPVTPAEKRDKLSALRVLRDRVRSGFVQVFAGSRNDALRDEWSVLRWDDKMEGPMRGQEDHAHDATLYALRALRHYRYSPKRNKPRPGTPEFDKLREERMLSYQKKKYQPQGPDDLPWWDR